MEKITMQDLKKCAGDIANFYGLSYSEGIKLVAYYNAGKHKDLETVAALVAGDYSRIPEAASAVGVSLGVHTSDHETVKQSADHGTVKKSPGSPKKNSRKATTKTASSSEIKNPGGEGVNTDASGAAFDLDGDMVPADMVAATDYDLPPNMADTIEGWINDFAQRFNIDLSRLNSQQWRSCCDYIGQQIKNNGVLRDRERERVHGGMIYKPERLEGLLYLWAFFSGVYKQVPLEGDFIAFLGVHRNYFYDYDGRGLTSTRGQIVKKAREIEERGALSAAVGGGSNAVGGMFTLKTRHNYTETQSKPEMIVAVVPTADSIPIMDKSTGLLTINVDK